MRIYNHKSKYKVNKNIKRIQKKTIFRKVNKQLISEAIGTFAHVFC